MIRTCLVALWCWVAVVAHGVFAAPAAGSLVLDAARSGAVTAPHDHDDRVTETERVAFDARPTRGAAAGSRTEAPPPALLNARGAWQARPDWNDVGDVRAPSRTASAAARILDLRREALRARPGRRLGRLEAGTEPPA